MIPPILSWSNSEPLFSLQNRFGQSRNLEAALLDWSLSNAMDERRAYNSGGDPCIFPARENGFVNIAVERRHGKRSYLFDVGDIRIDFSGGIPGPKGRKFGEDPCTKDMNQVSFGPDLVPFF